MWKTYFGTVGVIILLLGTMTFVSAQAKFTVLEDGFEYTFNEELVFDLRLQSEEEIPANSVELLYRVGHGDDVVNRRQPEYEPGKDLTLQVRNPLDQGEIPPASIITYRWEIMDVAGHIFETDEQSFQYMDDRFDWQSKTEGPITIYWHGRLDGERLLNVALVALNRLQKTIDYELELPVNIVTYIDRDDMQEAMPPRGQTFDEHIVTLGTVVAPDVMLLLGSHSDVDNTIAHELTHMVVGAVTENPFAEIPWWLNEGLAMYNQDYVESSYQNVLKSAVRDQDLDTVRRLSGRTGDPSRVNLWYAEVWSVIDYLVSEHGQKKMAQLLQVFSRGAHPDDALMEVYGFDRDGLTARWWEWLGAEVPPALRGESDAAPDNDAGSTDSGQSQSPDAQAATTQPPAVPESRPAEEPATQPAGGLVCCAGLLPLSLLLLGGLWFRRVS